MESKTLELNAYKNDREIKKFNKKKTSHPTFIVKQSVALVERHLIGGVCS